MNDLYGNLISDGYDQVKLIGVGKSQHMSSLSNWTNGNDASVCADAAPYPTWVEWDADQRDLYVLDHEGNVVFHENITNATNWGNSSSSHWLELSNLIEDLISQIPGDSECTDGDINNDNPCNPMECYNGQWVEMIIDCAEQMGVPCNGGVYVAPPEGVCCSTCVLYGDSNSDGVLNVLDVVAIVNLVLSGGYDLVSDMNGDETLNVLDIVSLVNIILS